MIGGGKSQGTEQSLQALFHLGLDFWSFFFLIIHYASRAITWAARCLGYMYFWNIQ
jgi:hypothetical protein